MEDIPGIFSFGCGSSVAIWNRSLLANWDPMPCMAGGLSMGAPSCKAFPIGVVGHWPAGNVEIQPLLSMTCALLGGNAALVRVPDGLDRPDAASAGKVGAKRSGSITNLADFYGRLRAWPPGSA